MTGTDGATAEPTATFGEADRRHMRRAVHLARRGWGRVAPNPLVGAVVVRDGTVVGEGWHRAFGADHAEVMALRAASSSARGGTLYASLEPCSHHGKTPPCVDAILAAGVRRVVAATRDPHRTASGGLERLREAGVTVSLGVEAERAVRTNAAFLWSEVRGLPFGALKLGLTLDGRIAERPGVRSRVTGARAWREVHRLRAGHDAVLVGRRTAAVDDPRLTARGRPEPRRPPVRVVLDPGLRISPDSTLARTAREVPTWVLAAPDAPGGARRTLEAGGVRVLEVPLEREHRLDVRAAWRKLAEEGIASVLVEGGGRVASSLLRDGLLQRMHLIYASRVFGVAGVPAFPDLEDAPQIWRAWSPTRARKLGGDVLLELEHAAVGRLARRLVRPVAREERSAPVAAGAGGRGREGGA